MHVLSIDGSLIPRYAFLESSLLIMKNMLVPLCIGQVLIRYVMGDGMIDVGSHLENDRFKTCTTRWKHEQLNPLAFSCPQSCERLRCFSMQIFKPP